MISAESFVETARGYGFSFFTGVPCSFLSPFINYVIDDDNLSYISSANEGDALATAAGAAIGGIRSIVMMQNSGLGNAVSPITSLSYTFRIPLLIITTHRGAPELIDEPQHELMGEITGDLLDLVKVPWEYFPAGENDITAAIERASKYMKSNQRPYGFIMEKGTVEPYGLKTESIQKCNRQTVVKTDFNNSGTASRNDVLRKIISATPESNTVVIATTGYTGRELYALKDRNNHIYMVGSMGCASSLGLGLSLARPDLTVVIVDGDGAALMRMGNLATIGSYGGNNLVHILLDNEAHDSTGSQATVSRNVSFAGIASACGYGLAFSGNNPDLVDSIIADDSVEGARFLHLKIRTGTIDELPRPHITPVEVLNRLMKHINTAF